jgi:hypothetical protein
VIGPAPFERDERNRLKSSIATLFVEQQVLFTNAPFYHIGQREGFVERLNSERHAAGRPPLTATEVSRIFTEAVDLIIDPGQIRIRPWPDRMDLAFAADELLQQVVSKLEVKFVNVSNPVVRRAIKARGECWRVDAVPLEDRDRRALIRNAKRAIGGRPIYYHNSLSGTRWLTYHEFCGLGNLDEAELRFHLLEIAEFTVRRNLQDRPEVDFFGADPARFAAKDLAGAPVAALSPGDLRRRYGEWKDAFREATPGDLRTDDYGTEEWRRAILRALFVYGDQTVIEQVLTGLSPEFYMNVRWLPGGRFVDGRFRFDPVWVEKVRTSREREWKSLCDPVAKNIVQNLIREYGDIEYLNVGRVSESLKREVHENAGRRAVYIAEVKLRHEETPVRWIMRLLKWGVWEHLDDDKSMEHSVWECSEYVDYWMDRWLGCRQLGMRLPARVTMRWLNERYTGKAARHGQPLIRTPYFERSYLSGTATNRIPRETLGRPGYAEKLAVLLGKAAASSLIVGRGLDERGVPFFDHGDELVREGPDGLPEEILAVRHIGAFRDCENGLEHLAAHYVHPVLARREHVPDPRGFAELYLGALREELARVQRSFRDHRGDFLGLFDMSRVRVEKSFAWRWAAILDRLDRAEPDRIVERIRRCAGG